MPTSSIFTSVKLETKEQVESFCDAWDKSEANIGKVRENIKGDYLATPEEIKEITKKLLAKYNNGIKDKEKVNRFVEALEIAEKNTTPVDTSKLHFATEENFEKLKEKYGLQEVLYE